MARCSPGDQVVCYVSNGSIVNVYSDELKETKVFDIISLYDSGYMLYIPESIHLRDLIMISRDNYKKFNADKKFIGSYSYYINEHKIVSIYRKVDGMCCLECTTFCSMASPNQQDEKTFICWSCRRYKFYR